MDEAMRAMEWWKRDQAQLKDFFEKAFGGDPELRKKWEEQDRVMEEMRAAVAEAEKGIEEMTAKQRGYAEEASKSMQEGANNGRKLGEVFQKFQGIIDGVRESARAMNAELRMEDGMRAFADQEAASAWEASLDATRAKLSDAIMAKREAAGEAFNDFVGPQQMTDEAKGAWQDLVARQGMSREERKAQRAADRELEKNTRRAADERTREELKRLKKESRENAFDDLKNNRGWINEEATKKNLRDKHRAEAKDAVKGAAQTLIDIKGILERLATA
jgi:hypothetical protein